MSLFTLSSTYGSTQADPQPIKHIFFDFHGVLALKESKITMVKRFFKEIVWQHPRQVIATLCNWDFYKALHNLLHMPDNRGKNKITEMYFDTIIKLGYPELGQALIEYANNIFTENQRMIQLLQELKESNLELHLFSNIGPKTEQDARKKFPFLQKFFPKNNLIDTTVTFKPEAQAFEQACKSANCRPEQVIVIDDKTVNGYTQEACALAAAKATKKGHVYHTPEHYAAAAIVYNSTNHQKTIETLTTLGLLLR
jgi:FMN phosphatase YigB (HAD superfamily)